MVLFRQYLFCVFLLLQLLAAGAYAQSKPAASVTPITNLINVSRQLYIDQAYQAGYDTALVALNQALQIKNDTLVGMAAFFAGLNIWDINSDTAIHLTLKSIDYLKPTQHPWLIHALRNAVLYYQEIANYPKALEYAHMEYAFSSKINDTTGLLMAMNLIGYLNDRNGNYDESISWSKKALALAFTAHDTHRIGMSYGYMGIAFDEKMQYDSALIFNQLAIDYLKYDEDDYYLRMWQSNLANTHLKLGNYGLSEFYLLQAIKNSDSLAYGNSVKFLNLARAALGQGQTTKAKGYIDLGYKNALQFKEIKFIEESYEVYSMYYEQIKDYNKALHFQRKFKQMSDSILNLEKFEKLATLQTQFNAEQQKNELLKAKQVEVDLENQKLALRLNVIRQNRLIAVLIILAILVALIGVIVIQYQRRKHQDERNAILLDAQQKASKEIINAQEKERLRIAKDLHDGVVQEIAAIGNKVLANTQMSSADWAQEVATQLQNASKEVRNISHQLMPRALVQLGLVPALRDMIEKFTEHTGIETDFEVINIEPNDRFDNEIEITLYRVAQELVTNAVKHSNAQLLMVTLSHRNQQLNLMIEDNGKGYDLSTKSQGIGFSNVQSRLALIGGDFHLESAPGHGFTAIARIPIPKESMRTRENPIT